MHALLWTEITFSLDLNENLYNVYVRIVFMSVSTHIWYIKYFILMYGDRWALFHTSNPIIYNTVSMRDEDNGKGESARAPDVVFFSFYICYNSTSLDKWQRKWEIMMMVFVFIFNFLRRSFQFSLTLSLSASLYLRCMARRTPRPHIHSTLASNLYTNHFSIVFCYSQ